MYPFASPLHAGVHRFIVQGEGSFEELATRVFAYQFEHNEPYRRLCVARGVTPDRLEDWRSIPTVPTAGFKHLPLVCRPLDQAQAVFLSSGTSRGLQSRSKHYVFDLRLYHAAIEGWFAFHLLPDLPPGKRIFTYVLMPSPTDQPTSSLAYMLGQVVDRFGAPGSGFFLRPTGEESVFTLEAERLASTLQDTQEPAMLLGTSYSFMHLLGFCQDRGLRFHLPPGSRLMDTGGFKGRSREISRDELYLQYDRLLGIPETHCINEYGMSEMLSQFYDRRVGDVTPRLYHPPPWVRSLALDPETLQPAAPGEAGILCHWDLANIDSVMALQTEDVGRVRSGGFELLGRVAQAEARGCSLLVEEWLDATRGDP